MIFITLCWHEIWTFLWTKPIYRGKNRKCKYQIIIEYCFQRYALTFNDVSITTRVFLDFMTYRSGQFILQAHIFFPINYTPWHTGCACTNRFLHFAIITAVNLTLNEKCISDYSDKYRESTNVPVIFTISWMFHSLGDTNDSLRAARNDYKSFEKARAFFSVFQ